MTTYRTQHGILLEVVVTPPGRSQFDQARWRCLHPGCDTEGVWRSAISRQAARAAANRHALTTHRATVDAPD